MAKLNFQVKQVRHDTELTSEQEPAGPEPGQEATGYVAEGGAEPSSGPARPANLLSYHTPIYTHM